MSELGECIHLFPPPPPPLSLHRLLAKKRNFIFEFRDSIQFKNVPAPIKCYYLLDNTDREEYAAIISTEDLEQVNYTQFMISRTTDTPPSTPMLSSTLANIKAQIEVQGASGKQCPMFVTPDLNVTKPTPTSTPNPTPPLSRKSSNSDDPDYDTVTPSCPAIGSPDRSLSPESSYHLPTTFMATMRNSSMSPLQENLDEEDSTTQSSSTNVELEDETSNAEALATNAADEGIVMRKISDVSNSSSTGSASGGGTEQSGTSSSSARLPSRKISDVSNHSGESGIESTTSKVSDVSKDGLPSDRESSRHSTGGVERKTSNSSNESSAAEDELATIRHARAGSVSRTIEKFDSMTKRVRKSGLPTTVISNTPNGGPQGEEPEWDTTTSSSQSI